MLKINDWRKTNRRVLPQLGPGECKTGMALKSTRTLALTREITFSGLALTRQFRLLRHLQPPQRLYGSKFKAVYKNWRPRPRQRCWRLSLAIQRIVSGIHEASNIKPIPPLLCLREGIMPRLKHRQNVRYETCFELAGKPSRLRLIT